MDFITQKLGGRRRWQVKESLKSAILGALYEPERDENAIQPITFNVPSGRSQTLKEKVLSKLAYPDMLLREQSVVEAHHNTLHWIFQREKEQDRPWASFCQWLEESDKQLYWITGKAGSGKSTLMKFISQPPASGSPSTLPEDSDNQPRCAPFLRRWAGNQPLLIASFYFWAVGSPMQRSREGMLRTLLHELLKQAESEMIASVMPESWEALYLFDEDPRPYSDAMLQHMMSRALQFMSTSNKICIFIDGLDEFQGGHGDLLEFFRAALNAHRIKMCISSRPWQIFEDAFQNKPGLRLQDLTLPDVKAYVESTLHPDPAFALLRALEPSFADDLVDNIATKADGVFLWVCLVVASLQKGIKAGDRVSDLQRRLDQLPPELEALFERMLDGLDPEYLDHAMQYFQLMEASLSISPPNVMVFSYADEEDEAFAINFPVSPIDQRILENVRDMLKKRLNSRSMGLLEITEQLSTSTNVLLNASRCRVRYLHRTVLDYIASADVKERLRVRLNRELHQRFDPHLRLYSAQLAFYKSSLAHNAHALDSNLDHVEELEFTKKALSSCLFHAAQVQGTGLPSMIRLIDALDAVYSKSLVRSHHQRALQLATASAHGLNRFMSHLEYQKALSSRERLFRSLIIRHEVVEYIRAKTQPRRWPPPPANGTRKLFWLSKRVFARERDQDLARDVTALPDLDWQLYDAVMAVSPCLPMIQLLLEKGADTQYEYEFNNFSTEKGTLWEITLAAFMIVFHEEPQLDGARAQVVRLMVRHGAPINRGSITKALQIARSLRQMDKYRSKPFCAAIEHHLKMMKEEA